MSEAREKLDRLGKILGGLKKGERQVFIHVLLGVLAYNTDGKVWDDALQSAEETVLSIRGMRL